MPYGKNRPDLQDRAPQFTLGSLLELIAGVGLFLALVLQLGSLGWLMVAGGLAVIVIANRIILAEHRRKGVSLGGCAVACLILLSLLWGLLPYVQSAREAGRRSQCANNMRNLALALHMYHDQHGHFPPPYVADSTGKPMHSWRVLILPYIEQGQLYAAYNFNEPWDGPNNRQLAATAPWIFRCPNDASPPGMTNYFYVVGPGRMKEGKARWEIGDFVDEPTIMLVESNTAQIKWLEPRDLTVEEFITGINTRGISGPHDGGGDGKAWRSERCFHCATHDAKVHRIRADVDPETLRAMLTLDGGEEVDWSDLNVPRLWPGVWVLAGIEVVFVALAIVRRIRLARAKSVAGISSGTPRS